MLCGKGPLVKTRNRCEDIIKEILRKSVTKKYNELNWLNIQSNGML
jgi:hypothetical protein